jgi:hypothetical protein
MEEHYHHMSGNAALMVGFNSIRSVMSTAINEWSSEEAVFELHNIHSQACDARVSDAMRSIPSMSVRVSAQE